AEQQITEPKDKIESGSYFDSNSERAVVVGKDVLKRLDMQVGDSLVLLGQGFRGMSATGLYPIKGTLTLTNPELNKQLVMLPLQTAQHFLAAEGRLTTAALVIDKPDQIQPVMQQLKQKLPSDAYEVMDWREMQPELVQAIEVDRVSSYIMLAVLYMVVGFGI